MFCRRNQAATDSVCLVPAYCWMFIVNMQNVNVVTRRVCAVQRIVRMNKTEDDELDAEELTDEELKQVAGHLRLLSLVAVD